MKKFILIFMLATISLFAATINTTKQTYTAGETIVVNYTDMLGNDEDWVGVYPVGASNEWDNVLSWDWTGGHKNGTVSLSSVVAGNYEVRAFFSNSFHTEDTVSFSVEEQGAVETSIATSKTEYNIGEEIKVTLTNMLGNGEDWVGIYPAAASNDWDNVIAWDWTGGIKNGDLTLANIPAGDYEARAFFANSFNTEAKIAFKVKTAVLETTVYEDAEDGLSNKWRKVLGEYEPAVQDPGYESDHCVKLKTQWVKRDGYWQNLSEYWLDINNANQRVLEVDVGGVGVKMPHFFIGVRVATKQGDRSMMWDSFFAHENVDPFRADYGNGSIELCYPSPVELVRGWFGADVNMWNHFKVDLDASLKLLEPTNSILYIKALTFSGGYLDNIKLSSN